MTTITFKAEVEIPIDLMDFAHDIYIANLHPDKIVEFIVEIVKLQDNSNVLDSLLKKLTGMQKDN